MYCFGLKITRLAEESPGALVSILERSVEYVQQFVRGAELVHDHDVPAVQKRL
jgi:hypothetical protein